jgi:hypothetical protein
MSFFLAVFAVVAFYLAIASLRTDLVNALVVWLAFANLVLLSIGAGARIGDVTKAGAAVTMSFAALAWYHAARGHHRVHLLPQAPALRPAASARIRKHNLCVRGVQSAECGDKKAHGYRHGFLPLTSRSRDGSCEGGHLPECIARLEKLSETLLAFIGRCNQTVRPSTGNTPPTTSRTCAARILSYVA